MTQSINRDRVHPRECGGAHLSHLPVLVKSGPSPRVRGSLDDVDPAIISQGSIPASAGEPFDDLPSHEDLRVHPRECGGASMSPCAAAQSACLLVIADYFLLLCLPGGRTTTLSVPHVATFREVL